MLIEIKVQNSVEIRFASVELLKLLRVFSAGSQNDPSGRDHQNDDHSGRFGFDDQEGRDRQEAGRQAEQEQQRG